jgi:23S rRNA pseudouridine1911/1915/1917 synthase
MMNPASARSRAGQAVDSTPSPIPNLPNQLRLLRLLSLRWKSPSSTSKPSLNRQARKPRGSKVRNELAKRLDVYLQARLRGISRNRIQKLIDRGGVTINGQVPKASTIIRKDDIIDIILPPRAVRRILPEPIPIHVMYEDQDYVIINKQANLIVHPARGQLSGTLINGLAYRFAEQQKERGREAQLRTTSGFNAYDRNRPPVIPAKTGLPGASGQVEGLSNVGADEFRPGIVHRLDRNTTGVMVVAKNDETHWAIARQFENRSTLKAYLAVVHGNFEEAGGAIEMPIGRHPTIREANAVRHDSTARHALTLFRVREQYQGYALVELELKTGRTHQIRVHLQYMGHPIVGDVVYGGEPVGYAELDAPPVAAGSRKLLNFARDKIEGQKIEAAAASRSDMLMATPALHASLLSFMHPRTHERVKYTAPLHEPMATLVRELRKRPNPSAPVAKQGTWVDLDALVPQE